MGDRLPALSASAEVIRIGDAQSRRSPHSNHVSQPDQVFPTRISKLALWAREHTYARRRRERFFSSSLFRDPAWDLLLELFIAHAEGRSVRITSACRVASTSTSTGLRWIATLEAEKLIVRERDTNDGRASFIHLSADGLKTITEYLEDIVRTHHTMVQDKNGHWRARKIIGGDDV